MAITGLLIIAGTAGFFCFPYLIVKYGKKSLYVIVPYLILSLAVSVENIEILSIAVTPAILGIIGGYVFLKRKNFQIFVVSATILLACVNIFQYHYMIDVLNYDLYNELEKSAEQMIVKQNISDQQKAEVIEDLKFKIILFKNNSYFMNFLSALFISVFSYILYKIQFRLIFPEKIIIDGIEKYQLNEYLIFLFILFLAGTVFIKQDMVIAGLDAEKISLIARNGLLIVSLLYLLQAIGVFKFFLVKMRMPVLVLPLSIVTLFAMGQTAVMFISILLSGIGLLDLWADFRKLNAKAGDGPAEN